MRPDRDVRDLLPLKPAWFHILVALGDGPRHGYAVRSAVEERTEGRVTLWPATLYGSIRRLEEEGLIAETDGGGGDEDDPRRRYYGLTPRGRAALSAEADRLRGLADAAHRALGRT